MVQPDIGPNHRLARPLRRHELLRLALIIPATGWPVEDMMQQGIGIGMGIVCRSEPDHSGDVGDALPAGTRDMVF
jgi:hypothetical protein